jgi:hypothetical protein
MPPVDLLLLFPVAKVKFSYWPFVVLVSGAVRAALFVERVVVPLYFLLVAWFVIGCQSMVGSQT